ncbi:MAG: 6-carboxytetrahydropterin synthase, partial [Acidobacteria bacterium]|nr:6-carboxytetrahydropterin synthase [Acidobacteriota bacterium]
MKITLERRYRFSASHLYRRPEWNEEENSRVFGKCAIEPGHGHNYRLWVAVEGEPDPRTGFVIGLPELDGWVQEAVLEPLDHRHLNQALEEFAIGR